MEGFEGIHPQSAQLAVSAHTNPTTRRVPAPELGSQVGNFPRQRLGTRAVQESVPAVPPLPLLLPTASGGISLSSGGKQTPVHVSGPAFSHPLV